MCPVDACARARRNDYDDDDGRGRGAREAAGRAVPTCRYGSLVWKCRLRESRAVHANSRRVRRTATTNLRCIARRPLLPYRFSAGPERSSRKQQPYRYTRGPAYSVNRVKRRHRVTRLTGCGGPGCPGQIDRDRTGVSPGGTMRAAGEYFRFRLVYYHLLLLYYDGRAK